VYNCVFFTCPQIKAKLMNYLSLTGKQFTCVPWCLTLWDSRCFYANEMIIKCMWSSHLDHQKLTYLSQKSSHVQKDNLKIMITHLTRLLCRAVTLFVVMNFRFSCEFVSLENTWRKKYDVFQCKIIVLTQFVFWSLLQYLNSCYNKTKHWLFYLLIINRLFWN
jgi:hypothetical protein